LDRRDGIVGSHLLLPIQDERMRKQKNASTWQKDPALTKHLEKILAKDHKLQV
jgi:hypothetical protein